MPSKDVDYQKNYRLAHKDKSKEYNANYRLKNKTILKELKSDYYFENKEQINAKNKEYYCIHKDEISNWGKQYYLKNRTARRLHDKNYYLKNQAVLKTKTKQYWKAHRNELLKKQKEYYTKNKMQIRELQQRIVKKRYATDGLYRMKLSISAQIRHSLNKNYQSKEGRSWEKLLGYTKEQLCEHLSKQFSPNMSLDNYGSYWHIDHKTPISFAKNEQEVIELFQLNNLQPLEAQTNIEKSNKVIADLFNLNIGGGI